MNEKQTIVFVCEHGAAKSIVAAAHFNRLAAARGLAQRAVARGTHPDAELAGGAVTGLAREGLESTEPAPRQLSTHDLDGAERVVTFCDLPDEYVERAPIERWEGVPPVSEDYGRARTAIVERLKQLIETISSED